MAAITSSVSRKDGMHHTSARIVVIALMLAGIFGWTARAFSPSAVAASNPINTKALYHNTRSTQYRSFFGAIAAGSPITLTIRTALKGADSVTLVVDHADVNLNVTSTSVPMKVSKKKGKYEFWTVTYVPPVLGIDSYQFEVKKGSATEFYTGTAGGDGGAGMVSKTKSDTGFHLTVYASDFAPPSWAKDMVIYQIFPDRFYNGDPSNDHSGMPIPGQSTVVHANWNDQPANSPNSTSDFFGGDLQGIIDKLPYLKSLGVNTLYVNPIFEAATNHKYDTADYYTIDPRFGTMDTFKALVAAAHADGMHLILDGVFNHTGSDSVYFNAYNYFSDVGAAQSKSSPYYPWYNFYSWPSSYADFPGSGGTLPQLQENDPVENFIFKQPDSVAQHWLGAGADGWRLDGATFKSQQWWQAYRSSVKAADPNAVEICECDLAPIDATKYLLGNEFDGDMNYRWREDVLRYFNLGAGADVNFPLNAHGFYNVMMGILQDYPTQAVESSMTPLTSHDLPRILSDLRGSIPLLEEVVDFQMTWLGAPTVYYGDEAGAINSTSTDDSYLARGTFPWDHQNTSLEAFYKTIIAYRANHSALRDGSTKSLVLNDNNAIFSYMRSDAHDNVAVFLNNDTKAHKITASIPHFARNATLKDALTGKSFKLSNGKLTLSIPATGAVILSTSAK
jgi:cyclomaltodextrinase / maltogenic alpha-amylase / neopullulanase